MKCKLLIVLLVIALCPATALAQYAVPHGTFSGGGGVRSGSHIVYDTAVQTAVSVSSGGDYIIKSGFWYNAEISSTVDVAITFFDCRYSGETVSLSWSVSASAPFLGYNLYRSEGDSEDFNKINGELLEPENPCVYTDEDVLPGTSYRYLLGALEADGSERLSAEITVTLPPKPLTLFQNYPNPFNPSTVIRFFLPREAPVTLVIYDATGARVRTLCEGTQPAGYHSISWDGLNESGNNVSTGVYFYRLQAGKKLLTKKMVLLR
jgi:hypothetical protein